MKPMGLVWKIFILAFCLATLLCACDTAQGSIEVSFDSTPSEQSTQEATESLSSENAVSCTPTPVPSDYPTESDSGLPSFPAVSTKDAEVFEGDSLDFLSLLVVSEEDLSSLTVQVDAGQTNLSVVGSYTVTFTLTDTYGRTRSYTSKISVLERPDTTPPVVTGSDFEITVGDSVSYKKQIEYSDDKDPYPTVSVDNSRVDLDTPGVYPVVYTVSDSAGNKTVLTIYLTVLEKEEELDEITKYVYEESEKILARITTEDMTDLEVAYAIYRWTKNNIAYWGDTAKGDWVKGAYDTFKNDNCGDCYGFYAVSKALLTVAGIDHMDMEKDRQSESVSRHYWLLVNVGDGWYHFDTTRFRYPESNFFMLTNEEILKWDAEYYPGTHTYITEGIPEIATKSIQDRVDYNSSTLKY